MMTRVMTHALVYDAMDLTQRKITKSLIEPLAL
jgi:hypothetical protein